MAFTLSREAKVGIIGLITLGLVIAGLNFLNGSKVFGKSVRLNAYYDNINGLKKGALVMYRGMQVGRVEDLILDAKTGQIKAVIEMLETVDIPTDTKATIYSPSIMSDPAIRFDFGKSTQFLTDGQVLQDSLEVGLVANFQSQIDPIKKEAEVLSKQLNQIAGWVYHTLPDSAESERSIKGILTNTNASVENIKNLSAEFDEVMDKVNKVIVSIDALSNSARNVVNNIDDNKGTINASLNKLDATMGNIKYASDSLNYITSEVRKTLADVESAILNIKSITAGIENGEGSAGLLIKDKKLYENAATSVGKLDVAITNINDLIKNIKERPQDYLNVNAKVVVFERKKDK